MLAGTGRLLTVPLPVMPVAIGTTPAQHMRW
jgi:hypothetical protein